MNETISNSVPLLEEKSLDENGLVFNIKDVNFRSKPPNVSASYEFFNSKSLDYEIVDSEVNLKTWQSQTSSDHRYYTLTKWMFALLIALSTGFTSFAINMAAENLAGTKFTLVLSFMQKKQYLLACIVYTVCNVCMVFVSALLCTFIAPEAAGSGIPEVKAYLNGIDLPKVLSPSTLVVKIIGSIGSVAGGLAVGKEGPLVHSGACFAALLGTDWYERIGFKPPWLCVFQSDRERRDLVTCGAAAGVAAAFRAPVGGVLFALEEASSWWRSSLLWKTFFTSAIVGIILRALVSFCKEEESCGGYGNAGFIIFDESEVKSNYGLLELLPVLVLGITGGLLGSLFNSISIIICKHRTSMFYKGRKWVRLVEAVSLAILTSVLQYSLPWFATCQDCPDPDLHPSSAGCPTRGRVGNFKAFDCPAGEYNDLAGLLFNTNDDAIRNLYSTGTFHEYSYRSLLLFLVVYFFLAVVTYGIAVPSGLFVPAILSGATYGRMVGMCMTWYFGIERVDEGTYALLGSASFLGGSMHMTVSLCIILLELTGNLTMLPLIMLTLLVSKLVGDRFGEGIYDAHLHLKKLPMLEEHHAKKFPKHAKVTERASMGMVCLCAIERVGRLYDVLSSTTHDAFPVIHDVENDRMTSSSEPFMGSILRSHVIHVLMHKNEWIHSPSERFFLLKEDCFMDAGKPLNGEKVGVEDIELSEEDMDKYIDLRPYVNKTPYIVCDSMNLSKAYALFRQLGLRHLFVVPRPSTVVGVLTRHDFILDQVKDQDQDQVKS